jgi:phage/conjugal plasmid C-4 type zinc finger TraR family protein
LSELHKGGGLPLSAYNIHEYGERDMAVGWAGDDAVQNQIDATVESAVIQARSKMPTGESLTHCEECDNEIPEARRKAIPGVHYCVSCQSAKEKKEKMVEFYNRRGSKDSQLK